MISTRAVKKAWIPPKGISCLPRKARKKVPREYQYWHAQEPAKRREIRDELLQKAARIMKNDASGSVRFKLLKQTWKGLKVIREGPSRTIFWVVLKRANEYTGFVLKSDPIHNSRVACLPFVQKPIIALWKTVGEVSPGSELNTTKNTPSRISVLDQGAATVRAGFSSTHAEYRFQGEKLQGVWVAAKQKDSKLWTFVRIDGTQRV